MDAEQSPEERPPTLPPPLPPTLPPPAARPERGFWAALGLGLAGVLVMLAAQLLGAMLVGAIRGFEYFAHHHRTIPRGELSRLGNDPLLIPVCVLLSLPVVWIALFLMVRIQRGGKLRDYLGLRCFRARPFLLWTAALAAVLFGGDRLLHWMGDKSSEEFALRVLLSGDHLPWILLAIVVGAPLVEEPLFRGFLYRGMARSRWTTLAAILVPNGLWVALHAQYRWPTLLVLFAMGLVFALARHFSGSTLLPILLHFFASATAVLAALTMLHPVSLRHGIDLSRRTVLGHSMQADLAKKNGDIEAALASYDALLELDPQNQNALKQRGLLHKREENYDRALADFTRLQKLAPKNPDALYQRAYVFLALGKKDPAIADLDRLLKIDASHFRAHWLRAIAYQRKGDQRRAIADNEAALKLNPKFGPAITDLGTAYLRDRDYDRAIAEFDRAIRVSPRSSDNYHSRGYCYRQKGDYDRAIADFTTAIRLDPDYESAFHNRAIAWQSKGDYRQAYRDFTQALDLYPNYTVAANTFAWMLATCPDPIFRDGPLAIRYAEQACRATQWKNPTYLDTLAAAYAERGEWDKAIWWQEKCLQNRQFSKTEIDGAKRRLDLYRHRRSYTE